MRDPKVKLATLLCLILGAGGIAHAIYFFLMHPQEFIISDYIKGLAAVGGTTLSGFFLVWLATKITSWKIRTLLGFQETLKDEAGTSFSFPVHLSKYKPDIVAPPLLDETHHPLEAEILGFLNNWRHFPLKSNQPTGPFLYDAAVESWNKAAALTPVQRLAILAQYLSKTLAFVEVRKPSPHWMFWKKDQVTYRPNQMSHGGASAFLVATFPAFKTLPKEDQTALLTALKFAKSGRLPSNCPPQTQQIVAVLQETSTTEASHTSEKSISEKAAQVDELITQIGETIYK